MVAPVEGHGSRSAWRVLWGIIVGVGVGLIVLAGQAAGLEATATDRVSAAFESAGRETGALVLELGGWVVAIVGTVGLLSTFKREIAEADAVVVQGLEPRPAMPSQVQPAADAPVDTWADEIEFDPTRWDHPAASVFVVDGGKSAGAVYDAVRAGATGTGLLVAMLQGLTQKDRKLVVALGTELQVGTFEAAWRPSALAADVAWLRTGTEDVAAIREQLKGAAFMVLAAARA